MAIRSSVYNNPSIGQGFANLASMFAPPDPATIAQAKALQLKADEAAQKAKYLEQIDPALRPYIGAGVSADDHNKFLATDAARRGVPLTALDPYVYAGGRDASKTFAGSAMAPLNPGQVRYTPPGVAQGLGINTEQFGVIQTPKDVTTTVPGAGGSMDPVVGAVMRGGPPGEQPAAVGQEPPLPPARRQRLAGADPVALAAMGRRPVTTIQGKTAEPDRALTAEERAAAKLKPEQPAVMRDGQVTLLEKGGVTVNTGQSAATSVAKALGDQVAEGRKEAEASVDALRALSTAQAQLDAPGGVNTGAFAEGATAMQKIGAKMGLVDPARVVNTETFQTQVAPVVLATVKGLGAGSGISNADREFAEKAAGGKITLDEGTIRRTIDIGKRAARYKLERHNALAKQFVDSTPELPAGQGAMLMVPVPEEYTADAQTGAPKAAAPAAAAQPVRVNTPDEARALPPGTPIILPDGRTGVVPGAR